MGKRLTKALRGKRRWIGLHVSDCKSRDELKKAIETIAPSSEWKLTVFEGEKAILRVRLEELDDWKSILADPTSNIHSVTTSGKIRLVKERMGLS